MPKHDIRVTLTPSEYEAARGAAERRGETLASFVRKAVMENCVKPAVKERRLRAISEIMEAEPADAPEDLDAWKREYGAMKAGWGRGGLSREEFLRITGPPDHRPIRPSGPE